MKPILTGKKSRLLAIAVILLVVGAAATTVLAVRAARAPIALKLIGPFDDPRMADAFRAETGEFELRDKRVSVEISQADYAEVDQATASVQEGWDLAIGSSRLADGRPSVVAPASPLFGSLWLLWYNKGVLAKAGAALPASGSPYTIPEFEKSCAAVAKAGFIPIALGSAYGWPLALWIQELMAADGSTADAAKLIDPGFDLKSPALAKAIAAFRDLAASGAVDPTHASKDWPQALRDLVAGRAGFCLLDRDLVAGLPASERDRLGALPLPGSSGQAGKAWAIGSLSYIAQRADKDRRRKAAAKALLDWLTSEGATARLSFRLGLPFFAGGKGPTLTIPSAASVPASAVIGRIKEEVARR
jgi:hypothetical protein